MTDHWTERLSDYIDGELDEATARDLEQHLESCKECRENLDQLRAVAARATNMRDREPGTDLWPGIAARIKDTAPGVAELKRPVGRAKRLTFSVPQLLAAGIALMFATAGTVWIAMSADNESSAPVAAEVPAEGEAEVLMASFDDPGYDAAVAELERLLNAGRDRLDPETVAVLEQSLETIDRAIAEARAALQTDPTNHYLTEHLSETMNQKVRLLQRAAMLTNSDS